MADPTPTPLTDVERLALLLRPWTTCDDGGRFDHGSLAAAQSVLSSDWLADRVAAARADERERLAEVPQRILNTVDPLDPGHVVRVSCVEIVRTALAQPADTEGAG